MGYLPLIILLREAGPSLIGVVCVVVKGNLWTIFCYSIILLMLYRVKLFGVRDSMGDAKVSCFSPFCMEELVQKVLVKYLDYGFGVSNVVSLAGTI